MSEPLKECPFCGGKAALEINDDHASKIFIYCKECGISTDTYIWTDKDDAVTAWNRRAQPDNAPLTLEELEQRIDPVWVPLDSGPDKGFWCLCYKGEITPPSCGTFMAKDRPNWTFYRRKPEGGAI